MTDQERIYRHALDTFGADAQIDMAIEEGAELTVALQHHKRGRQHNAQEEIADVLITAGQMRLLFGAEAVDAILAEKLVDLERRIDGSKG